MNVKFEKYTENRDEEVGKLLSRTQFMDAHASARDSVIHSVFAYQNDTDKDRIYRGVVMKNDKDEIVGYMGAMYQPCTYKGVDYDMYQTSSAFIDPNYRGNLSHIFKCFADNVPAHTLVSSIGASLSSVIHSTEKAGFIQINQQRFATQYVYPISMNAFVQEYANSGWKKIVLNMAKPLLKCVFRNKTFKLYESHIMPNFNNDYTLVEQEYKKRNFNNLVVKWNRELLQLKFEKRLNTHIDQLRENEIVHVCVYNTKQDIIGSMVVAKVREFNKLMLIDMQTIEHDRSAIVASLLHAIMNSKYASLLIYGIEECYMECIKKQYKLLKKQKNWRIYYIPSPLLPTEDVSIVYSDDDVNY